MIYTHVARKGVTGVTSPLDLLDGMRNDDLQAAVDGTTKLDSPRSQGTEFQVGLIERIKCAPEG